MFELKFSMTKSKQVNVIYRNYMLHQNYDVSLTKLILNQSCK